MSLHPMTELLKATRRRDFGFSSAPTVRTSVTVPFTAGTHSKRRSAPAMFELRLMKNRNIWKPLSAGL